MYSSVYYIPHIIYYLFIYLLFISFKICIAILTESEVITGKSPTEAPSCIDCAIARSIHQGQGLRFPCNDRTDEVNKSFIIWPF